MIVWLVLAGILGTVTADLKMLRAEARGTPELARVVRLWLRLMAEVLVVGIILLRGVTRRRGLTAQHRHAITRQRHVR